MRATQTNQRIAFTLIELLVMIVTLVMLGVLLFAGVPRVRNEARLKQCVNNLKYVGLAFRIWGGDSNDGYPMHYSITDGGSLELVRTGAVFHVFQVMSNELSDDVKLLICPSDNRIAAMNFDRLANSNLSYFVGIDANDTQPDMFLSGDRNLTNGPLDNFQIMSLSTNSNPGWTEVMHKLRGNIGLADGSVQNFDTARVQSLIRVMGGVPGSITTNRLVFP
jgi:type II secretory pathway pseudopilin PulG